MSSTDLMVPIKKSQKERLANGEDLISSLPDDIMSHILSSLPTVDVVATCVLSKQWENKWTSIYSIDTDDKKRYQLGASGEAMFLNFMERVFRRAQNVTRIRLKLLYKYNSEVVHSWISALLRIKVEILHIDIQEGLVIWGKILNNTSLRELVLRSVSVTVPASNCLRNLINLCLEKVEFWNENSSTDTLLFTFPVLEILKLVKCTWSDVKLVEICAPALKTFMSETKLKAEVDRYQINILGVRLAKFTSKGGEPENFSLSGSKIGHAALQNTIDLNEGSLRRSGLRVQSLLKEFSSNLEELTLSLFVAQALLESKQSFPLLKFDKLQRLVLCSSDHFTSGNTEALLQLLHAMPFLKFLVIDVLRWDDYDYDAVESIPSCMPFSLEEIEFVNITGMENVFRLAKFLLENAVNLKKFHVDSLYEEVKFEIAKAIALAHPNGSTYLTVVGNYVSVICEEIEKSGLTGAINGSSFMKLNCLKSE